MAHDVFISYAMEDKEAAEKVCRALEGESIRCWIAPRDVTPGVSYEQAILDAIEASKCLVLIFSAHTNASQHVQREIRKAFEEGSRTTVFPFRLEDASYSKTLYYYLGGAQWVDASSQPLESSIHSLVEHVRAHLKAAEERPGGTVGPGSRQPALGGPEVPDAAGPVVSGTGDGRSFKGTGDGRTFQGTGDGRKPLPWPWVAVGAGALLLAVVVAFVATRSRDGGNVNPPAAVATPAVNSGGNAQGNSNAQQRTPSPTPTPTTTRTPTRVFPTNLNLKRPLNRNR